MASGEGLKENIDGVGQAGEQWVGSPPELPAIGVGSDNPVVRETERNQGERWPGVKRLQGESIWMEGPQIRWRWVRGG